MSGPVETRTPPAPKLLRSWRAKVRIAAASLVVLAVGAWLAPRQADRTVTPVDERAAPMLQEQVQRRTPPSLAENLPDVVARARPLQVEVLRSPSRLPPVAADYGTIAVPSDAAASGVFVASSFVLTHDDAMNGRVGVQIRTTSGDLIDAAVAAYEPSTGLVLLRTTADSGRAQIPPAEPIALGQTLVAFSRQPGRDVAVPLVVVSIAGDRWDVTSESGGLAPGLPVYTLAGELAAIVVREDGRARAVAARSIIDPLVTRATSGRRRVSLGISYQPLTESMTPVFGTDGIIVTHVVAGSPADETGIVAGDVLVSIGETTVASAEAAAAALASLALDVPVSVTFRRDQQVRTVEITPALAYTVAALERAAPAMTAPEARVLFPDGDLEAAGVAGTARVLSFAGRVASTRAQVDQIRRRAKTPLPVLVQHGGARYFALIEPRR
jgi:S1-C subfamily serine protease